MSAQKKHPAEVRGRSRREFLAQSGALAAASAVTFSGMVRAHVAEDPTIRLALIGCGGRGTGAVGDAFSVPGAPVRLYTMADLFEDRLQGSLNALRTNFADRVDVMPERCFVGFDAYRKAIDELRPGDIAILATHSVFRPVHLEYAVQKGVNVFMEKSFAVDAPANRRLLRAAEESEKKNLKVGCGFMWRHSKARQALVDRIRDGAIGDVHTLRIYRVHGPVYVPKRAPDRNPIEFQIRAATCFNWVSGGFFVDWHCHNVDQACWVKDAWPVEAQAMGGRCFAEAGNNFDHYCIEYTFADGAKLFAFSRHMNNCWETYSDYVHGAKGSAVLMESLSRPKPRIYKSQRMEKSEIVWECPEPDVNPYHAEWAVLLDAVMNDKPHNEARRAGLANLAALMGRMAAHTGQRVTWDEAMNSEFKFVDDIDHLSFESTPPIQEGPDGIFPCAIPGVTKEI
ncbi:Gfo/Idh/MocA family protein [Thermopirellula anaerolimosa]